MDGSVMAKSEVGTGSSFILRVNTKCEIRQVNRFKSISDYIPVHRGEDVPEFLRQTNKA